MAPPAKNEEICFTRGGSPSLSRQEVPQPERLPTGLDSDFDGSVATGAASLAETHENGIIVLEWDRRIPFGNRNHAPRLHQRGDEKGEV